MNQRRDVVFGKKYEGADGQEKIYWHKIGSLFHKAETGNISIFLDVYPPFGETLMAFKPKPKDAPTNITKDSKGNTYVKQDPATGEPIDRSNSDVDVEDIPF